jgi:hypothetical protein
VTRDEVAKLEVGKDTVIPLIGRFRGEKALVIRTETHERCGARNGWVTVLLLSGDKAMYAGEEIGRDIA